MSYYQIAQTIDETTSKLTVLDVLMKKSEVNLFDMVALVKYEGGFMYGKYYGKGNYFSNDGDMYVGDFFRGYFYGNGTLFASFCLTYEGGFTFGMYSGFGKEYYVGTPQIKFNGFYLLDKFRFGKSYSIAETKVK